jgi:hypothetical protein
MVGVLEAQMTHTTQGQQVLAWLKRHRGISQWQAIQMWRCTRLARVIHDLKRKHTIHTEYVRTRGGKRIAVYILSR